MSSAYDVYINTRSSSAGAAILYYLPPSSSSSGRHFWIYKAGTSSLPIRVHTSRNTDLINGSTFVMTVCVNRYDSAHLYSDGSGWYVYDSSSDSTDNITDNIITVRGSYTALSSQNAVLVDHGYHVYLPAATGAFGKTYEFVKNSAGGDSGTVSDIVPVGSETINGENTVTLSELYDTLRIISDGSNWLEL